jgi:hypothetical protein
LGRHAWVDMRLNESHNEGGFGIPNNTITRLGASYTTNARFVACWAPCLPCSTGLDDGQRTPGFSHLGCPPCLPPKRMHEDLLQHYDCTDQPAAAQPAPPSGAGSLRAEAAGLRLHGSSAGPNSRPCVSNGPNSRPCVSTTLARVLRSSPSSTVPVLSSLPRLNNSPLAKCGCKQHCKSSKTPNPLRPPPLLPESS